MSEIFGYAAGIFLRPRFGISPGLWDNFSELGGDKNQEQGRLCSHEISFRSRIESNDHVIACSLNVIKKGVLDFRLTPTW